jgi:hypothetical protein
MIRTLKIASLLLLIAFALLAMPSNSAAQIAVGVSIRIGPPALPVYAQPICPGPGYIWTPGYWAYGPDGYYWVPGTWVVAPAVGLLWTPGYWGWGGGVYLWHAGYWGPHVGFYGGINYGFGYTGVGFVGGEWRGGVYHYNTAVTNVNTTVIHNTYHTMAINNNTTVNRVSYNGGTGGTTARPTAAEMAAAREPHTPATDVQTAHEHAASTNRAFLASENHGHPAIAASSKPGVFNGPDATAAHGASNSNRPPANNSGANRAMTRDDRPPSATNKSTSSGNTNTAHPNTVNSSANRPNHTQSAQNPNRPPASHSNTSHPPQSHQSRPPEHESHSSDGHPNGGRGR